MHNKEAVKVKFFQYKLFDYNHIFNAILVILDIVQSKFKSLNRDCLVYMFSLSFSGSKF